MSFLSLKFQFFLVISIIQIVRIIEINWQNNQIRRIPQRKSIMKSTNWKLSWLQRDVAFFFFFFFVIGFSFWFIPSFFWMFSKFCFVFNFISWFIFFYVCFLYILSFSIVGWKGFFPYSINSVHNICFRSYWKFLFKSESISDVFRVSVNLLTLVRHRSKFCYWQWYIDTWDREHWRAHDERENDARLNDSMTLNLCRLIIGIGETDKIYPKKDNFVSLKGIEMRKVHSQWKMSRIGGFKRENLRHKYVLSSLVKTIFFDSFVSKLDGNSDVIQHQHIYTSF